MNYQRAQARLVATLGCEVSLAPQKWEQCLSWASGEVAFSPTQTTNTPSSGGVQVIRVRGPLSQHYDESGWTVSTSWIGSALDTALSSRVGTVLLDIDSPGGSVPGTQILADKIFKARNSGKRIVALANSTMASAAFWAFSAASELYAAPLADVGAVGVWSAHEDISEMLKRMGVKVTTVSSGRYKIEGSPWGALSAEAKAEMQKRCDAFCRDFHNAVARHRNTTADNVAANFGEGRLVQPSAAVARGMIDGIATLEQLLVRFGAIPPASNRQARAAYLSEQIGYERELRIRQMRSLN